MPDTPMQWNGTAYVLLSRVKGCGNLDGQTVTVKLSYGDVATGTIRWREGTVWRTQFRGKEDCSECVMAVVNDEGSAGHTKARST